MPTLEELTSRIAQLETAAGGLTTLSNQVDDVARQLQRIQGGSGLLEPQSSISAWDETPPFVASGSQPTVTYVGQAAQLLAGNNVTFTRLANTPFLRIDMGDNMMNADYVVDSNGYGTHTTLFGSGGAWNDAITSGTDKFIWICTTHTETVTSLTSLGGTADNQEIIIASGAHERATISHSNSSDALFAFTAANGLNSRVVFRNLRFVCASGTTQAWGRGANGIGMPQLEFDGVEFYSNSASHTWKYLIDAYNNTAVTFSKIAFRNCIGDGPKSLIKVSSAGGGGGPFIVEDCDFRNLTTISDRTDSTDVDPGGVNLSADVGIFLRNNVFEISSYAWKRSYNIYMVVADNYIYYTGTANLFEFGTSATTSPRDVAMTGNGVHCSAAGAVAVKVGSGSGTASNITIASNAFSGPGSGTCIDLAVAAESTTDGYHVINSYRDWTTNVGGTGASGAYSGIDHGSLVGLADDDHTQYLLASGTRNLTGNWEASTQAEGYYIQAAKFIIDDSSYYLDSTAGSVDEGYTTSGGSTYTEADADQSNATKITLTGGDYVSLSARLSHNLPSRSVIIGLYSDNAGVPNTLLASGTGTITSSSFATVTVTIAYTATAGTYWIAVISDTGFSKEYRWAYDAGSAGDSYENNGDTFSDGLESTWSGGSSGSKKLTAWATKNTNTPLINFDTNDYVSYNRTTDTLAFVIGSTTEMSLTTTGLTVANRVTVGNDDLTTDDLFYMAALSATIPGLVFDTNDSLNYDRANNKFNMTIASVHVVNVTSALFNSGSTTNVFDGDGRIGGYWVVGSVSAPTDTTAGTGYINTRLYIGNGGLTTDETFYLDAQSATIPQIVFDSGNYFSFDRASNTFQWNSGSGNLMTFTEGTLSVGDNATINGTLNLYGNPAGNEGGEIQLHGSGANNDWVFDNNSGALRYFVGATVYEQMDTTSARFRGALRVGSVTAPTNNTAGDITAIRLTVGSDAAFSVSAGLFTKFVGTATNTAAGATVMFNFVPTISPATDSSAEFRIMNMSALVSTSDVAVATVATFVTEIDYRALNPGVTGDVTAVLEAMRATGIVLRSTNDARQAVTTLKVLNLSAYSRPSGTGTVSVTDMYVLTIDGPTSAGATVTNYRALTLTNPGASFAPTSLIGIDLEKYTRGATDNIEFRNAGKMVYTPTAQVLAAATDTIVNTARVIHISNSTGASLTLTSDPTISTTGAQSGQLITLVNIDTADDIVLRDDSVASSALRLPGAANLTLGPKDSATFIYISASTEWWCIASANL